MYDELSIDSADYQALQTDSFPQDLRELEKLVSEILQVEKREYGFDERVLVGFVGELLVESSTAFEQLDAQLKPRNLLPQLSRLEEGDLVGKVQVLIFRDRPNPQPRPWWPNALLFFLTILSLLWAGANIEGIEGDFGDLFTRGEILKGWVYAVSLMLILGSHEMGHYFMARHHGVSITLPYFIPFPIALFGTMGAFIQQRDFPRNRRQLFDIGISGPLAGLVFAVPILILGVMTADVNRLPTAEDCEADNSCVYLLEGNSLLYGGIKYVVHGQWLPNSVEDMTLNQMAFAGWTGLFVTAINLVPIGQWDGGHIFYALFGKKAQRFFLPILGSFLVLLLFNSGWLLWVLILFFLGRVYNVPLDDVTPLDNRRRMLGFATFIILFLIFTPNPMSIVDITP